MEILEDSLSERELYQLQKQTFGYFERMSNPENGLIADSTKENTPCSIAVVGLALTSYPVAAERSFLSRSKAIDRTLKILRFFWNSRQGTDADATGNKGFYYHFLDMKTGRRAWKCELSTIDSAYLIAGALIAASYFDGDSVEEREIRELAEKLYRRADWKWAQNRGLAVTHGWKPEKGFLKYRWYGYSEAIILYVLGLGSPTYRLPEESYREWTSTYLWKKLYGFEFLYAGPIFIHQLSHLWIDFRQIQDEFMRSKGIDYFENSRRATYVQQHYAIQNPKRFNGYGQYSWGITASDGPGPAVQTINGIKRRFYDYRARSIPYGPDDGTLAPWALVASLPFAPEIVLPSLNYLNKTYPQMTGKYGYKCSFNPTFRTAPTNKKGWISQGHYGLDQGPVVLMIENFRSGLIWKLSRKCPYIIRGLLRAGFQNGWICDRRQLHAPA